eukprot:TRINITY_DN1826_c0_g2_i1.p2 TRINITY_DN1826_c0_g2~~TRINITY_DN1826_c0_g2_i1.p2  ORF type:complete len:170 (+),score=4.93 TRINITY_DN1826_c0_g2_i1:18-527(+)
MATPKRVRTAEPDTPSSASKSINRILRSPEELVPLSELIDALVSAVMLAEEAVVKSILERNSARADFKKIINGLSKKFDSTPLISSVRLNQKEITQLLLQYNASLTEEDLLEKTPLEVAMRKECSPEVKQLVLDRVKDLESRTGVKRPVSARSTPGSPPSTPIEKVIVT